MIISPTAVFIAALLLAIVFVANWVLRKEE